MADPTKPVTPEATLANAEVADKSGFDVKKALNTKGFAEFLATHKEVKDFDMSDSGALEAKFETFQIKERVKKDMKELFSSIVQKDFGIKLGAAELKLIDDHIEDVAITEPDALKDIEEQRVLFKELPGQLAEMEAEVQKLSQVGGVDIIKNNVDSIKEKLGKVDSLNKDKEDLNIASSYMGVAGKIKYNFKTSRGWYHSIRGRGNTERDEMVRAKEALDSVDKKYGELKKEDIGYAAAQVDKEIKATEQEVKTIEGEIKNIEATLAKIGDLEKKKIASKGAFDDVRKNLLASVAYAKGLTEAIQKNVYDKFNALLDVDPKDRTTRSHDSAQELLDRLRVASQTSEAGIDVLGDKNPENKIQGIIDQDFQEIVSREVENAVSKSRLGDNALTRLEDALKPLIERKKYGSKEDGDALDLVVNSIKDVIEKLPDDIEGKAKRLLLCRVLISLNRFE